MRKRNIYTQGERATSKVPTILIMCVVLFCILYFGKSMSENLAQFFVTNGPSVDNRNTGNTTSSDGTANDKATSADDAAPQHATDSPGAIIYKTNDAAAKTLLQRLADRQ